MFTQPYSHYFWVKKRYDTENNPNIMFSGSRERPEDPEDADLQALRRGQPHRAPPRRQEEEIRNQNQERQLVAQIQRNLPFVSFVFSYIYYSCHLIALFLKILTEKVPFMLDIGFQTTLKIYFNTVRDQKLMVDQKFPGNIHLQALKFDVKFDSYFSRSL